MRYEKVAIKYSKKQIFHTQKYYRLGVKILTQSDKWLLRYRAQKLKTCAKT